MNTNLMCATGDEIAAHDRVAVRRCEDPIPGFACGAVSGNDDASPVGGVATQWKPDDAFLRARCADDNRQILLRDTAGVRISLHPRVRSGRQCNQNDARGVFIKTAEKTRPYAVPIAQVPENPVENSPRRVAIRRMNDDAGGLVDRHDVFVLIEDVERYGFWCRHVRK